MGLEELIREIIAFRDERDWAQFHTPRNLATAVAIESGELLETMLWKTDKDIDAGLQAGELLAKVERELADVLIFALLLCDATQIDPIVAMQKKLRENAEKYPVDLSKGKSDKYTELGGDEEKKWMGTDLEDGR